jgi:formylglycine-generating enzyme required for sulfatase activity
MGKFSFANLRRPGDGLFISACIIGCLSLGGTTGCGPAGDSGSTASSPAQNGGPDLSRPCPVTTASGVPMIYVPAGEFMMGSKKGNPDEQPPHRVKLSAFLLDQFEVTHELMAKVELPDPSHWQDNPKLPVEQIRWRDAKQYCNERSLLENLTPCYDETRPGWPCDFSANGYRLPTEAEWEYACRAGTTGEYDFGAAGKLKQYAWFAENSQRRTHPVGTKKPNRWGFYDLYGNVSEWCQDVYAADYYARSPVQDPTGPEASGARARRVLRGGNWKSTASMCRAAFRQGQMTGDTDACFATDFCGFRCVRRVTPEEVRKLLTPAASPAR